MSARQLAHPCSRPNPLGAVLNTPSGQLIIASAMLQDVIGIIMLGELQAAAEDASAVGYLYPILSATVFLLVFSHLAAHVIPSYFPMLLKKFHHHHEREGFVMASILLLAITLIPACHFSKGSYLLGCFLAGMCFCTDHHSATIWQSQVGGSIAA